MVILVASSQSVPVKASTETINVGGEGTHPGGSYVGGTSDWHNLTTDEDPPTTYWSWVGTGVDATVYRDWAFSNMVATPTTINSVTITGVAKVIFANNLQFYYWNGSSYFMSGALPATGLIWETFTYTWNTNPATLAAWTKSDIDSALFGMSLHMQNVNPSGYEIAYLKVDVDYVPASAPSVTTSAASVITATSATLNGIVTDDQGDTIDYYGFVWDTVDEGDPGNVDPSGPPGAWASGWKSAAGDYGENAFAHDTGATLAQGTTYYVRGAAHNSAGWSYGSVVTFSTLGDPSITTVDASNVTTTTAQLNALIVSDGGQLCDVRFGWDTVSHAAFADYANITAWVSDTYSTGDYPSVNISGLVALSTYHFRAQVRNDISTQIGGDVDFTAANAVNYPTLVTSIPYSTRVNVSWIKGAGAANTILRYSTSTYPATSGSGTLGYSGTGNSVIIAGLTPGTTIYISLWGLTSGTYSTSYATSEATTLAYDQPTSSGPTLTTPTADPTFTQSPSAAKVSTIPLVGTIVQMDATAFNQPVEYLWYFIWMMAAVVIGIAVYMGGGHNYVLSGFSMLAWIGIGVWWVNVVAGGIIFLLGTIGVAWALTGFRRVGG